MCIKALLVSPTYKVTTVCRSQAINTDPVMQAMFMPWVKLHAFQRLRPSARASNKCQDHQPFLQPDQLSAQQLVELYQTCYLTTPETQKQALQLLVNMPWTDEVYDALCEVFTDLIQQPELCKELLLSEGCGNMCGMQVWHVMPCLSVCMCD